MYHVSQSGPTGVRYFRPILFGTKSASPPWDKFSNFSQPLQWCVFTYNPPLVGRADYSFTIWDGDCTSTWHSEPTGSTTIAIDPACYFAFGSKLADLVVFFGASSLLLGITAYIAKPLLSGKAR